jgi:5-methylcytosine-specific restriction endonuclease McrA
MSTPFSAIKPSAIQFKRLMALDGYVFAALGVKRSDVATIENAAILVNTVYESNIKFSTPNGTVDEMWGFVSGLTKGQRKKLRLKNCVKVPYQMSRRFEARRAAKAQRLSFYDPKVAAARQRKDAALLARVSAPNTASKEAFYKSWEWRTLRMEVLKEHGRACQCCGAAPGMKAASGDPVRICVDHIKPLSKFWEMRLDRSNLQILCDECNQGKGNWDQTDFRTPVAPDEWIVEDDGIDDALIHQLTDPGTGRLQ